MMMKINENYEGEPTYVYRYELYTVNGTEWKISKYNPLTDTKDVIVNTNGDIFALSGNDTVLRLVDNNGILTVGDVVKSGVKELKYDSHTFTFKDSNNNYYVYIDLSSNIDLSSYNILNTFRVGDTLYAAIEQDGLSVYHANLSNDFNVNTDERISMSDISAV